ncbi:MAG TPA: acylphosphatase [archaeon]|nr:acylphosphatase [archaeon]
MLCCKITVRGKVQGVGFRAFVKAAANSLSVSGWCRNLPDGSVEITVKCDGIAMEKFLEAVKQGPRKAVVEDVSVFPAEYDGGLGFAIR